MAGVCILALFFLRRCGWLILHRLHLHARGDAARVTFFHALVDVGVFRGDLRAALAQGFLHDAQILRLLIEVRAAAVAKEMARVAGLL